MTKSDLDFLRKFSLVIGFLIVLLIVLIIAARYFNAVQPRERTAEAAAATAARIAPVGAVYAGASGQAAAQLAEEAARKAATSTAAYGGTLDGKTIYDQLCTGCHTGGAGGAPKLDAAGMGARASKGLELLVKHAIEGFTGTAGVMPAKGGNPALTDEQVQKTVEWMLDQSK